MGVRLKKGVLKKITTWRKLTITRALQFESPSVEVSPTAFCRAESRLAFAIPNFPEDPFSCAEEDLLEDEEDADFRIMTIS